MRYLVIVLYILCFGIADCLWVNANQKNHMMVSMLCRSLVTTTLFFCLIMFQYHSDLFGSSSLSGSSISLAIAISTICFGGQYFYVKSLRYSSVAISITLISIFTFLLSIFVSVTFYHERIGLIVITLMLLTLLGVYFTVGNFDLKTRQSYRMGMRYILLSSICWGVGYSFVKAPIQSLGVINFSFILEATILVMNLIFFLIARLQVKDIKFAAVNSWQYLLALGLLIFCGTVLNSLSYNYFGVVTINIVGKVGIVIPIAYALLFLGEKVSKKQSIGIIIILVGAAAVSYYAE